MFKKKNYFDYTSIQYHNIIDEILKFFKQKESKELYRRLIYNLYDYTFRLPASLDHHHNHPFGLFQHSLETTLIQLEKQEKKIIYYNGTRVKNTYQTWAHKDISFMYSSILALYHDCGKIIHYAVIANKIRWNIFNPISLRNFIEQHKEASIYYDNLNNINHEQFNNIIFYIINKEVINELYYYLGYIDSLNLFQHINFQITKEEIQEIKESDHSSVENENIIEKISNTLSELSITNKIKDGTLYSFNQYSLITIDLIKKLEFLIKIDQNEIIEILYQAKLLFEYKQEHIYHFCTSKQSIKKKFGIKSIILKTNNLLKIETNPTPPPDTYDIFTYNRRNKVQLL